MTQWEEMNFTLIAQKYYNTRMHSSRMRTARLLPVSPNMHCSGGGDVPARGGVPALGGCTCPGGVYLPCGVPALGGYLPALWGEYLLRYSPPVNRMTGRCKNITLPQTSFTCLGGVPACLVGGVPAEVLPPCEQNDRQVQKYYLAPNFVCGR